MQKLGSTQRDVLREMANRGGVWRLGCGWNMGGVTHTVRLLERLEQLGLVQRGSPRAVYPGEFRISAAGLAAVGARIAEIAVASPAAEHGAAAGSRAQYIRGNRQWRRPAPTLPPPRQPLSSSMMRVLHNLDQGLPPWQHLSGRKRHGATRQTARALAARGWTVGTDQELRLTEAGRAIAATLR